MPCGQELGVRCDPTGHGTYSTVCDARRNPLTPVNCRPEGGCRTARAWRQGVRRPDPGILELGAASPLGVQLVSVMDHTDDSYIGDLVATIIDGVNEYQSRASGADISYKMAQKVKNGGTVGRAKIGYLNLREPLEGGGSVATIITDPERAPYIRMAFELYATGKYGFVTLHGALADAGLRTRPTPKTARPTHLHPQARADPPRPLLPRPGHPQRAGIPRPARTADHPVRPGTAGPRRRTPRQTRGRRRERPHYAKCPLLTL
jgi:hypothetical protein